MYGWIADGIAADACIVSLDSVLVGCGVRPAGSRGFDEAKVLVVAVFDGRYTAGCGDVTTGVGRLPRCIDELPEVLPVLLLLLLPLGKRDIGS